MKVTLKNVSQGHADVFAYDGEGGVAYVGFIEQRAGTRGAGWYSYDAKGNLLNDYPAAKRSHAMNDYTPFKAA